MGGDTPGKCQASIPGVHLCPCRGFHGAGTSPLLPEKCTSPGGEVGWSRRGHRARALSPEDTCSRAVGLALSPEDTCSRAVGAEHSLPGTWHAWKPVGSQSVQLEAFGSRPGYSQAAAARPMLRRSARGQWPAGGGQDGTPAGQALARPQHGHAVLGDVNAKLARGTLLLPPCSEAPGPRGH